MHLHNAIVCILTISNTNYLAELLFYLLPSYQTYDTDTNPLTKQYQHSLTAPIPIPTMNSTNIKIITPNPRIIPNPSTVANGSVYGFEGAIIPFIILIFVFAYLFDHFCWREKLSRWITKNYSGYWKRKYEQGEKKEQIF